MGKFEITLKAQKSVLDGKTCYEKINIEYLDKLIHSRLLKTNFNNPFAQHRWSNELEQLMAYKELYDPKTKVCAVKYNKVPCLSNKKKDKESYIAYGRVNPEKGLGLYNIRRQLRQTLCKEYYTDIDIENCHPAILLQICKMYEDEFDFDCLDEYVNDRQKCLHEVMSTYNCSRDQAKVLFIILLYFGGFDRWVKTNGIEEYDEGGNKVGINKLCKLFKKELGEIGEKIVVKNEEIRKFVEQRKEKQGKEDYNEVGTVVSFYLQEIENRILETMYEHCVSKKYVVNDCVVLCADGIMIETDKFKPQILDEFNKVIKKKFDFDLKFTVKEMKQDYISILDENVMTKEEFDMALLNGYDSQIVVDINIPFNVETLDKLFEEDLKEMGGYTYIELFHLSKSFKYFNEHHAFSYLSTNVYTCSSSGDFKSYAGNFDKSFNHLEVIYKKKKGKKNSEEEDDDEDEYFPTTKFTTLYDKSKYKNKFSSMWFNPNTEEDNGDKLNLFRGFKYDTGDYKYDITKIQHFLDHIKFLCNNDEKASQYVINWISQIIQSPHKKTKTAILFYSLTNGVGKNIFTDILEDLFDGYNTRIKNTQALVEKFNSNTVGKLFVVGDEINGRASEICNELKDIITRDTEIIEFKGKDKYLLNDYKNYILTTNNENVLKIENTDRRFVMIECPEEKKEKKWYDDLGAFRKDKDALTHLFNYFKSKDISKFRVTDIVVTDYKKHLIMNNLPAYFRMIKDEYDDIAGKNITIESFYKDSIEFARRNRLPHTYTDRLCSQQLKKVFGCYNKLNKERKSSYLFPKDGRQEVLDLIEKTLIKS